MTLYDTIGAGYRDRRRPDPRIAAAIAAALGDSASVVNVGAGTGSYEPRDRRVIAVEPSITMIRQRDAGAAPVVRATAAQLPLADASVAAALAVLTIHHWPDPAAGLRELARVARDRVVILTWDPDAPRWWLLDYLADLHALDRARFPTLAAIGAALGPIEVRTLPIPHDCSDGFTGAYWRRPRAYLDPDVRAGMSTFARLGAAADTGLARLAADLATGDWDRRNADLLARDQLDVGYRIVIARSRPV